MRKWEIILVLNSLTFCDKRWVAPHFNKIIRSHANSISIEFCSLIEDNMRTGNASRKMMIHTANGTIKSNSYFRYFYKSLSIIWHYAIRCRYWVNRAQIGSSNIYTQSRASHQIKIIWWCRDVCARSTNVCDFLASVTAVCGASDDDGGGAVKVPISNE